MNSEPSDEFRESFDNLPTGVQISIEVSNPTNGAVFPPGPVHVDGFATIGEAAPAAQINLSYLLDVSGSSGDPGACGGDLNNDGDSDTVLDCEIAALLEVNELAASSSAVAMVGAGVFGTRGAAADVKPGGSDADLLTEPSADLDSNNVADMEEVLRSINYGEIRTYAYDRVALKTSYGAGLQAMVPVFEADDQARDVLIFVSDGRNNTEPAISEILPTLPVGTVVYAFAVGPKATCDAGNLLGSLRDMTDATGGTCTEVPDVSDLPSVLPEVIGAELTGIELRVDDEPVAIETITQVLPLEGPATFKYSTTLYDLAPGEHQVCGTVTGVDALGTGDVSECVLFNIESDPEPEPAPDPDPAPDPGPVVSDCGGLELVADGSCQAYAPVDEGCSYDPPGPYPIGTTDVIKTCLGVEGRVTECTAVIDVIDGSPPDIQMSDELKLWPPDHKTHEFNIDDCIAQVSNSCTGGDYDAYADLDFELVSLSSDELENDISDGNTCEDTIMITGKTSFTVRGERRGDSDGRVYAATYRVTDAYGNQSYELCQVTVPSAHSKPAVIGSCELCIDAHDDDGDDCDGCPSLDEVCK